MKKTSTLLTMGIIVFSALTQNLHAQKTDYSDFARAKQIITKQAPVASAKAIFMSEAFTTEIPATWTITNTGTTANAWVWDDGTNAGGTLDGTGFAFADSDAGGSGTTMDVTLTSPAANTSAASLVLLSFDFYYNNFSSDPDSFIVQVYNGTSWVTKYLKTGADTGAWSAPAHLELNVTAEKNAAMQVRFRYRSPWGMYMGLDNVVIMEPAANDVGMASIDLSSGLVGSIIPKATVQNFGTSSQTFDVTMTINPGGYTNTQTVTSLAAATTQQVSFSSWNATGGNYAVEVYTQLAGDGETSNDTMNSTVTIASMTNKAFGYIAYTTSASLVAGPVIIDLDAPSVVLQLAADAANFVSGGAWANNKWYGIVYTDNTLITLDTATGARTEIGPLGTGLNGISYNPLTATMYGVSSTGLYSVDMTTGTATLLGESGVAGSVFINLACNPLNGSLYTLDIVTDSLFKLDKATGVATLIGDIGTNAAYAQDAEFAIDGTFYLALYDGTTSPGGMLSVCDTTTALLSGNDLFGDGVSEMEICGFAIPYLQSSLNENSVRSSVFPNPASEFVVVDANANISIIEVVNINGQVVASQSVNDSHAVVNVKNLSAGTYILNIVTDNGVVSKKLQIQ
ncbi:MAG: hypothetical protein A2W93_14795 [Bacteroidetes bacterium GWF2_43_63]|nr:MAG: hypothetical protein A2W94_01365 [Bacteroidetes bacterium GWE2_42_42]OFY52606.1 MAG: hypothetical protein A2W93_14795 [Bacteroidetes bacterium GWF2_43_63]HBG69878.1 hypothetical protein [Bacteroidales bacterium]HCB62695.1 hypothetical protein [Bacteroidales bacterium]HCY23543.1 hypothetical protein [Bacteroidales bacterium]